MTKKPPLPSGGCIGVMAPSSYIERADIEKSATILEERGYKILIHPQTYFRHNQSAGTKKDKLEALHNLYRNDDVDVIWAAGGGNRSLHIIDDIDYDLIKANPKPLIGFSDITALLNSIYAQSSVSGFHAPVFRQLYSHTNIDHALATLSGTVNVSDIPLEGCAILRGGQAEGTLIGGNLSLFQYLPQRLGTDFCKGSILLLEDCSEELSRLDRMLLHLRASGVFKQVTGLIFGQFTDIKDSARPFGFSLSDIIAEHTEGLKIPILMDSPFGHGKTLYTLPIGKRIALNITENTTEMYSL